MGSIIVILENYNLICLYSLCVAFWYRACEKIKIKIV